MELLIKRSHNFKDITNKRFGMLVAIRPTKTIQQKGKKFRATIWLFKCDCGNEVEKRKADVINKKTISCGCFHKSRKKFNSKLWEGEGEISKSYFNQIKRGALSRNLEFKISLKYMWDLFLKQNRKCAISGLDLVFRSGSKRERNDQTASLDRIDSSKGYTKDNIQWVHKHINLMKQNLTIENFMFLIKTIYFKNYR